MITCISGNKLLLNMEITKRLLKYTCLSLSTVNKHKAHVQQSVGLDNGVGCKKLCLCPLLINTKLTYSSLWDLIMV